MCYRLLLEPIWPITVVSLIIVVLAYKMWIILWETNEFSFFIHQIGLHFTSDRKEFIHIENKLNVWMKFVRYFLLLLLITAISGAVLFPITNANHLLFNIAFPLDWKNSEIAFWVASAFLGGGFLCGFVCDILTKLIWYSMLSISFKYKILGNQLIHMGTSFRTGRLRLKVSLAAQQKNFYEDFITAIQTYDKINGYVLALQY